MPQPSPEHAPIMRKMSDEILEKFPDASVFQWHVLDPDMFLNFDKPPAFANLDRPRAYVAVLLDKDGERIGNESLDAPENLIVARYEDDLGWSGREEGIGYVYSVTEAREITDIEGTGTLDPDFEDHPGLEMFR